MNAAKPVIAVVDDEQAVCKALERLLRAAGLAAKTFGGGKEFLSFLQTDRPACAVIDLLMPEMSGIELLDRLLRAGYKLPVIVITGDDNDEKYAQAMAAGIVTYLRKPVDGQVLLDAIAPAISREAQSGDKKI
ncbi:MAG: response regulator transcription factor [Gammaproteobacteria bacterium]